MSPRAATALGVVCGVLVGSCLLGGPIISAAMRWQRDRLEGWTNRPLLIPTRDIAPETKMELSDLAQQAMPTQFWTASLMTPADASLVLVQRPVVRLSKGVPLTFADFDGYVAGGCASLVLEAAGPGAQPPSSGLAQVIGALRDREGGRMEGP